MKDTCQICSFAQLGLLGTARYGMRNKDCTHSSLPRIPPSADILLEFSPNIRLTEVFLAGMGEHPSLGIRLVASVKALRH